MRFRILALTLMTLAVRPVGAGERLAVKVSPRMAFAPADLNVLTSIEHNDDNRTVEIIAESEQFYRSSELPLEGGLAPKALTSGSEISRSATTRFARSCAGRRDASSPFPQPSSASSAGGSDG